MRRELICGALLLTTSLIISGCASQGSDKIENEKKQGVAVETAAAVVADITRSVDVVGTLSPKFETDVKSEYLGVVTEVYVTEWVKVKKGQPLAKLDTREAENTYKKLQAALEMAKANLLEAEAARGRADREYERSLNLREYGLITQQGLEDARTAQSAAQARTAAAKAQVRVAEEDLKQGETHLAKALIRAPMDGVIAARNVNVGDLVGEVGTPKMMFKIVDNRLLDLVVTVPSHATEMLNVGQPLVFTTDAAPGKTFEGRVKFINPAVTTSDRSVKVTAEVPNPSGTLKGGLFVQGRIITGSRKGALQAPRAALSSWDVAGKKGELFVAENSVARLRKVQTGIAAGDMVEITGGLTAGEKIIVRGGFNVKDGDPVKISGNGGGK